MPKKKRPFFVLYILGIFLSLCLSIYKIYHEKWSPFHEYPPLIKIPIVEFGIGNIPCIEVEIENKTFVFGLDLGSATHVDMVRESLLQINEKCYTKTVTCFGFNGSQYQQDVYQVPTIKVGRLTFHNPSLAEEYENLDEMTMIIPPEKEIPPAAGRIGSPLFSLVCLFLDLEYATIAVCYDAEGFKEKGYSLSEFTKVPFIHERGLIEFEVTTPKGPLQCLLDTGATFNCLNTPNLAEEPLRKMVEDEKNHIHFSTFQIGDRDFGKITFRPLPIDPGFKVDTILGMEFLFHHQVFIDFPNQEIYFCPSSATYDPSGIRKTIPHQ